MRVSEPLPKMGGDERNKEQEVPEDKEEGPIKGQDSATRHTQTNSLCPGGPAWEGEELPQTCQDQMGKERCEVLMGKRGGWPLL